uniref:Transmembrane protein 14C n=1 Tax=Podarcis muralis TaxID=64176 RepID=A0A670ITB1_PODMU
MGLDWIGFGYAALVASGGMIGYAKAGSVPSLAAGLLFGSLAGLGAYQLSQDPKNIWTAGSPSLCFWNLSWYYGHEILQLGEIHACRTDCWCKVLCCVFILFILLLTLRLHSCCIHAS